MPRIMDEETPLLRNQSPQQNHGRKTRTRLPWRQLSILLLLQLSEPITSQVISPFLPQLIRDIGVTNGQDSRIGYYVGLMYSLFFLTEACATFHWSRMSDQIGRKPVILVGLFGLSASMWCFGMSRTFWTLVLSRCVNGALNGNVGVMKTMVVEITDPTNVAQAFGILPMAWHVGSTVGPLIGGSLARPAERFPETFGDSVFFRKYPYFLPCLVPATFTALCWFIAFAFMKETMKPRMTARQYLVGRVTKGDNPKPGSQVRNSPAPEIINKELPLRAFLIRPVLIATASYATFSLCDMATRSILPVFYAMPIEMGGLNLDPPTIGFILALTGISGGVIQWVFFAPLHDWLGAKPLFLTCVSLCIPMIALFPVINAVARVYGVCYFVWFLLGLQLLLFIFSCFSFALSHMFVSAAAPDKGSIGATNGIAQVTVSFMRALGPITVNSALSFSLEKHVLGGYLAHCVMLAMAGLTLWMGSRLPRNMWNE